MASGLLTAGVFDLGVRFGTILLGHVLNHGIDGLELNPYGRLGLGWVMALHAGHLIVLGGFPGVVVGSHDVATVAKRGAGTVKEQADEKSQNSRGREGQHLVKLRMDREMYADPLQKPFKPSWPFRTFQTGTSAR